MAAQSPTLVLIDGHALAYRAFYGMPDTFSTREGEKTNAVYGFTNMLLAVWKEFAPDYFIVTFDLGDTFRHQLYPDYKGTREKMPDDLSSQIGRIQELVQAFNMPIFTKEHYEADDLLGTLAVQAAAQGIRALIVTGDRDAFQLIQPNVEVIYPGRSFSDRQVYDVAAVEKRYGVPPQKLVDLKALVGDSSDNIPGVAGIGEKGGAKLLQAYESLDGIYANLDKISPSQRKKLEAGREQAYLSQKLGRIVTDVPQVELQLEAGRTNDFNLVDVARLFVELEFNTIFNRIPGAPTDLSPVEVVNAGQEHLEVRGPQPPQGDYQTVDTAAKLAALVEQLKQSPRLSVDVETDSTDEIQTQLVGIAITATPERGYYIPVQHKALAPAGEQASLFDTAAPESDAPPQLALTDVQAALAPILAAPDVLKVMHNAKFDMVVLRRHGMPVNPPIFDSMIASWLLNNSADARHGLKSLALEKLQVQMTNIESLIGSGKNQRSMAEVAISEATPYAAADVDLTLQLTATFEKALAAENQLHYIFEQLELPLIFVLQDMELAGVKIDVAILKTISAELSQRLLSLEAEIHQLAGRSFNINSTQQLSTVLFDELQLPATGLKRTRSGHYSTAAGVLESLAGQHPMIDLILEQRSLSKLKSTYVDALPRLVNPQTGRIHTNYNQIGISTGRLSSTDPNLQNIPIRTEQGREIRRAFVSEPGYQLIAADYSQVELRIMAHIADDAGLKQAFANDEDIHTATAAAVLGIAQNAVDKYQRRVAKAVNFGLAYGQSAFGLSRSTGMSREEAANFIKTYFEKYPGVKAYIENTKTLAAKQGYVETLLGRRRDFANLAQLRGPQRGRAEREAINMPIQGTAADIMKLAMINLHHALQTGGYQTRILLQVHDELVLEAPDAEVDAVAALTREVMSQAYQLSVPLKVDVEAGRNWLEMETIDA